MALTVLIVEAEEKSVRGLNRTGEGKIGRRSADSLESNRSRAGSAVS